MRKQIVYKLFFLSMLVAFLLASCSDMYEYKKFLEGGEIQYTGKIDSVVVFSGDERVAVTGLFISDPKVVNCRIYWNLRADSVDVPVNRTEGVDKLYQIIELPENSYSFEIFTYDALGNKSISVTAPGNSYGASYKASLPNRLIDSAKEEDDEDGTINAVIKWRDMDTSLGAYEVKVEYIDAEGAAHTVNLPMTEKSTTLANYKSGSTISHVTLFVPEKGCLDTFQSSGASYVAEPLPPKPVLVEDPEENEMDKTTFVEFPLPGDGVAAASVLAATKLWDGITQENWTARYVTNNTDVPQSVTINMGQMARLTKLKLWNYGDDSGGGVDGRRNHYASGHIKKFEVWGSQEEPNADGGWDGWTVLGTFEVVKPSGLPVGEQTQEDYDKAVAGFDFSFGEDIPWAQYIRIKNLGNWGGTYSMDIEEISLWGHWCKWVTPSTDN